MECLACSFQNPEGMKFCGGCGAKLEKICPNCNFKNPPEFKFCGECGHSQQTAAGPPVNQDRSFQDKLEQIQRYLPQGLTEKILARRDKIEGEKKQVTVMFCDMAGFTSLAEKLGSEQTYSLMDKVYEILIHKVHDYGGTVNEMTGDGIMALFGAPLAVEDAPVRAIRSAHAIHRGIRGFSDEIEKEMQDHFQLKMRIGIHTGTVVVGTLGNDLRVEFKAVGDTVNLASRMESLAEQGSTYVTETTFQLTRELFRFEALGSHVIKGRSGRFNAYRVIAPSSLRTRFDVSAERGLTPFQGRERELELLQDGLKRAMAGQGQAFSIMAEAGLGKSRLLYEFRKSVSDRDVHFMEGKCLSYSRNISNYPLIDLLKPSFGYEEGDGEVEIIQKVKKGFKLLNIDEKIFLSYFLEFFSIENSGIDPLVRPEVIKDMAIKVIKQIVLNMSLAKPLIIAIEDLHWVDKNSEYIFKTWLEDISGVRILLIFTYRPEYIHQWGGKSYHNQINLNRLSNRESLLMASHTLGSAAVHKDLEELILEKTEGVPFFIEEFIRSLKDLNIIQEKNNQYSLIKDIREMTIPSTVQEVVMARVDALPEAAKELLQIASVIEREFNHKLIQLAANLPEPDLLSRLSILKDAELIYERGIYPNSNYVFKHALTREVVFESILANRMEKLCNDIGRAMEKLFKDNLMEKVEILADYFIRGKDYIRGEKYFDLSARKAFKTAAFGNAVDYGKKRVHCLEMIPADELIEKRIIEARAVLGMYCIMIVHPAEGKKAVEPIIDTAINRNYKKSVSKINMIMGSYYLVVKEDYHKASTYYKKAQKTGEEVNDSFTLSNILTLLGVLHAYTGDNKNACCYFDRALDYNKKACCFWGVSGVKAYLAVMIYNPQGQLPLAMQNSKDALKLAEESGDIYAQAHANWALGISHYHLGNFNKAEKTLCEAVNFSQKSNLLHIAGGSSYCLGWIYFNLGNDQKAQEALRSTISFLKSENILPSIINACRILIARIEIKTKDLKLNDLVNWHKNIKNKWIRNGITRSIGAILMERNGRHLSEAETWIKTSMITNQKYGIKWELAQDYVLYSEWFKLQGDRVHAQENLEKALRLFTECKADGWVEKYNYILPGHCNEVSVH